jgi:CheY-like chemotaxis protein
MNRLNGRRVLVVEDDAFTAHTLCLALHESGATTIGPASNVGEALDLAARSPVIDAALLDVNLGRELVYPVAEALVRRRVPFIFATAQAVYDMPTMFWHLLRQEKPYDARALADRIGALCAIAPDATLPSLPLPRSPWLDPVVELSLRAAG